MAPRPTAPPGRLFSLGTALVCCWTAPRGTSAAFASLWSPRAQPLPPASPVPQVAGTAPPGSVEAGAQSFVQSYTQSQQAGATPAGPGASPLSINVLQMYTVSGVDEYAVCNDGSSGAYYYAPSPTGSNQWCVSPAPAVAASFADTSLLPPPLRLVYLEGGMWCWDQQSCLARMQSTPFEMSSTGWKPVQVVGGVFSTTAGNPFLNYNKVYLGYCSSDAWMGDAAASSATFGYAFRGQRIIAATMADLQARHGMAAGADVVFGGCSAGARGAMINLDYIQALAPPGSTVRGLIDSGLWVDVEPIDTSQVSLQDQTQMISTFIEPGSVIPATCAMEYVGEEWKCLFGVYRLPFVETPYLINAAQFDSFAMVYDEAGNVPATQGQVALADTFQQAVVSALQIAVQKGQAVFSATCLVHCLTADTQLYTGSESITADGQDIEQALTQWLGGGTPVLVSNCQGYPCVEQCPGGAQIPGIQQAIAAQSAPPAAGTEVNGVWLEVPGMGDGAHVSAAAGPSPPAVWMLSGRRLLRDSAAP